jgi:pimeloyl-[acyl-carrier protein] synthase
MTAPSLRLDSLDFDWLQPGALGAGYLDRLRKVQEAKPVFWSELQGAWLVARHADVIAGLKDPRLSNHRYHLRLEQIAKATHAPEGELLKAVRGWIFNMDGSDHTRLRVLLMKPFSKSSIDRYHHSTRAAFVKAIDSIVARGPFDFVNDLAFPFVAQSLLEIIGLADVVSREELFAMSRTIVTALAARPDPTAIAAADRVIATVTTWLLAGIEERRHSPRDDLLTSFVTLSEGSDRLTEGEIVRLFQVLMLAAVDTTSNTLSLMVSLLDREPHHREYIRAHPDRLPAIVEELQRYVGMMNMMHRIALVDFEWHGAPIKQGDMVYFMLAAGNRDPQVYEDPDHLDFDRKRKLPLMFAPGLHHCIGHFVARMWLEIAIGELYTRFARVAVLAPPVIMPNYMNIAFESLRVDCQEAQP